MRVHDSLHCLVSAILKKFTLRAEKAEEAGGPGNLLKWEDAFLNNFIILFNQE